MKPQIVYLAPMQLRKEIMIGNIYSAVVADFYNKVLKILGHESYFPFVVNVTGQKTESLIATFGLSSGSKEDIESFINNLIVLAKNKFSFYGITFDSLIRDDKLLIEDLVSSNHSFNTITVSYCENCHKNFGTDVSITTCHNCGKRLVKINNEMFSVFVDNKKINQAIEDILFFPNIKKLQLKEIVLSFPKKLYFCLEKERSLTLQYKSRSLDPKFVAIQALVFAKTSFGFIDAEINFFQGDVLKKFTYYSMAYLEEEYMPKRVVCHGLILGNDGGKLRIDDFTKDYLKTLSPKLIRAFFLSVQLGTNIKFSKEVFEPKAVGLIRILSKVKTMLSYKTLDSESFLFLKRDFLSAVTKLNYALAYQNFISLVNKYWQATRFTRSLNSEDKIWLKQIAELYFGEI